MPPPPPFLGIQIDYNGGGGGAADFLTKQPAMQGRQTRAADAPPLRPPARALWTMASRMPDTVLTISALRHLGQAPAKRKQAPNRKGKR